MLGARVLLYLMNNEHTRESEYKAGKMTEQNEVGHNILLFL